jgi:uncharacterized protein (TIGR02246 family)
MKRKWTFIGAASVMSAVVLGLTACQDKPTTAQEQASQKKPAVVGAQAPKRQADEAAIRASVGAFTKAYNAHDAKAIAALFIPEGQVVDEDGETAEGREAITEVFAEVFAETPKTQIAVTIDSIRFIGADLAVEMGTTKTTPEPGETPEHGKYTVLHVKRDGKWLMALARDTGGDQPSSHEHLRPLAWLIGEWVDEGEDSVVFTTCRWSPDKNFILQDIKLRVAGRDAMDVSQRIGWDPVNKRIRSWVFDSEGGYGEGVWARTSEGWLIRTTGVRADGTQAAATNLLVPAGKDSYVWRSTDRVIGDEVMPTLEVTVIRKPPAPAGPAGKK